MKNILTNSVAQQICRQNAVSKKNCERVTLISYVVKIAIWIWIATVINLLWNS